MTERNDRYEEDNYYRREERDDPNEMDRDESLNDCLLEIARLANDARALSIRAPREFTVFPLPTVDCSVNYGAVEGYNPRWAGAIMVREVL